MEKPLQDRMYEQFEIGKKLYAVHRLLENAPPLDRQKIVKFLKGALTEFTAAGGVATTGTDVLGMSGPFLRCENGDEIPYQSGRILAEEYLSSGVFR